MSFRIVITPDSCHVEEMRFRTLKDEATGEIVQMPLGPHGSAIGLGDYTTKDDKTGEVTVDTDAFNAAVQAKIVAVCGENLSRVIAAKAEDTAVASLAAAGAAVLGTASAAPEP